MLSRLPLRARLAAWYAGVFAAVFTPASIGTYWAVPHEATPEEVALLQALADSASIASCAA